MSRQGKGYDRSGLTGRLDKCPIDERPLKKMFGDDPAIFREILNDFIAPTQKIIGEIRAGQEKHSVEDIEMAAHKLKSSAKSVGAFDLGKICEILEKAALEKDWETINKLVGTLQPEMNEVIQYIKTL